MKKSWEMGVGEVRPNYAFIVKVGIFAICQENFRNKKLLNRSKIDSRQLQQGIAS